MSTPPHNTALQKYLGGYSPNVRQQVEDLLEQQRLGEWLLKKHPRAHAIRTDKQLYEYAVQIKNKFMSNAGPLNRVTYDIKIQVIQQALGQHHYISRVHGSRLKTVNEIRIASVFRHVPEAFLKMIVVHELAHFREKEHNKAFYQLCCHMEPAYHQLEFELRLYLTHLDCMGPLYSC